MLQFDSIVIRFTETSSENLTGWKKSSVCGRINERSDYAMQQSKLTDEISVTIGSTLDESSENADRPSGFSFAMSSIRRLANTMTTNSNRSGSTRNCPKNRADFSLQGSRCSNPANFLASRRNYPYDLHQTNKFLTKNSSPHLKS
jgi:hypothetical protein